MKLTAERLKGVWTALSVPFLANGEVDRFWFRSLVEYQVFEGAVDGFVVNGTTGESPCLSPKEKEKLFLWTFGLCDQKHLIANLGSNNTQQTLEDMSKLYLMGASAFMAVVPYYNRPPQRGLIKHFEALADKRYTPLILYNVPSRTGQGLSLESIVELSKHPNIIGIKEASGDLEFGRQIIQNTDPKEFSVLSGDDDTWLDLCSMGGSGVISVISHIIAPEMQALLKQVKQGGEEEKLKALKTYKEQYGSLLKALYADPNPIGIKMALNLMGLSETPNMRLPLVKMEKENVKKLKEALQKNDLMFKAAQILHDNWPSKLSVADWIY